MSKEKDPPPPPLIPPLAFLLLLFGLFLLLAVVVLVALFRKELDATGVALAIISLMGGLGGGAILRSVAKDPRAGDKDAGQ